jgi:hypothetical protein
MPKKLEPLKKGEKPLIIKVPKNISEQSQINGHISWNAFLKAVKKKVNNNT